MARYRVFASPLFLLVIASLGPAPAGWAQVDFSRIPSVVVFAGDATFAYRDPAAVWHEGTMYLYFTLSEAASDGGYYNRVAMSTSRDLVTWTEPMVLTPQDRELNYSSPGNVVRFGDEWILCVQSYPTPHRETFGTNRSRIFVMRSDDLLHWSEPELLKVKGDDVPESEMGRMIDPYLLQDQANPERWWVYYKQNGVSMSSSEDLVHWTYYGRADAGENVTVVHDHRAEEYVMFHSPANGIGVKRSDSPTKWGEDVALLKFDQENWSWAARRLTAATVVDLKQEPAVGKYVMFFHGDSKQGTIPAHGRASLAIAWSDDLTTWHWPGSDANSGE